MPDVQPSPAPRGRPRSDRSHRAILDAARELLAEHPLSDVSIEAVAARARVAKTTIYRRWRTKEHLALAVLHEVAANELHVADLGDVRAELVVLAQETAALLTRTPMGPVVAALVACLPHDPALAADFQRQLVDLRRDELQRVVVRAIARGELRPGVPVDAAAELFAGPLFYRLLMTVRPLDRRFLEHVVDTLLDGWRGH